MPRFDPCAACPWISTGFAAEALLTLAAAFAADALTAGVLAADAFAAGFLTAGAFAADALTFGAATAGDLEVLDDLATGARAGRGADAGAANSDGFVAVGFAVDGFDDEGFDGEGLGADDLDNAALAAGVTVAAGRLAAAGCRAADFEPDGAAAGKGVGAVCCFGIRFETAATGVGSAATKRAVCFFAGR